MVFVVYNTHVCLLCCHLHMTPSMWLLQSVRHLEGSDANGRQVARYSCTVLGLTSAAHTQTNESTVVRVATWPWQPGWRTHGMFTSETPSTGVQNILHLQQDTHDVCEVQSACLLQPDCFRGAVCCSHQPVKSLAFNISFTCTCCQA